VGGQGACFAFDFIAFPTETPDIGGIVEALKSMGHEQIQVNPSQRPR
jgi:hypothetical protein